MRRSLEKWSRRSTSTVLSNHPQPVDPPCVLLRGHDIPAVQRVAPELPGDAEIVGGNSRHKCRAAVGFEVEQLTIGPTIGTVMGHEYGRIAYNSDTFFRGVPSYLAPLHEEQEIG